MLLESKCEYLLEAIHSMATLHPEDGKKKRISYHAKKETIGILLIWGGHRQGNDNSI